MFLDPIDLDQAHERHERFVSEALRSRTSGRPTTVRRTIGQGFIALGRRIAADPRLELARSPR
jgi:hypothetical protein